MSLMLNALKRIEAKQPADPRRKPRAGSFESCRHKQHRFETRCDGGRADRAAIGRDARRSDRSSARASTDVLSSMPWDHIALPEAASLEATIDQLQAFVAEVSLPYDGQRAADATALHDVEVPVVAPVASDPYSATAQQILCQLPRDRSQVVLFTSPADGQGKTMTVARLAPRLAQGLEGNLLVVDANFRNPDMARWLAVAPAWRLPEVLAGAADWAAAVQTTAHERVSLLPGGTDARDRRAAGGYPLVGAGRGRMIQGLSHLLRDLASHYSLVVVDAASLAHRGTVQLAAVCDATYLVVRLGEGSPRMLREAVQVVQGNGGRLLGCVAIDA